MKLDAYVGKYIVDGKLVSSSPSAIETFDETTPFGCNRKWWFAAAAGLVGAQSEAMKTGDAVHKQIEHYLLTKQDALGPIAKAGVGIIDSLVTKYPRFEIEQWIPAGFEINGVKIRGRLDFQARDEAGKLVNITDWKTSSNIDKYGKTPYQLRKNTQMLVYRQYAEQAGCDPNLEVSHVYFQTGGTRSAKEVPVRINREQLAEGIEGVSQKLTRMKVAASYLDSEDVTPSRNKCMAGTKLECPYLKHCSKGATMSLFSKLATVDVTPVVPPVPTSVLPPDAPKSDPALAADPVPGFSDSHTTVLYTPEPAPEAPKKRGRKPKADNAAQVEALQLTALQPAPVSTKVVVNTITIGHTATINMGNYESAKVEVTMSATVEGDAEEARGVLNAQVRNALTRSIEGYQKK